VAIVSNKAKSKLEPRGELGKLLDFNPELKSYKVFTSDGRIVDTKHLDFLKYSQAPSSPDFSDDLFFQKGELPQQVAEEPPPKEPEEPRIKEEDKENEVPPSPPGEEDRMGESDGDDADIKDLLIPKAEVPTNRVLCDRTVKLKPVKYTHLTVEPKNFKMAFSGEHADGWKKAIDAELTNIKDHHVWLDQYDKPNKILHSTWVFKTKPATLSSPEKPKSRFCRSQGMEFLTLPLDKFSS
jgi:hypothetical protein